MQKRQMRVASLSQDVIYRGVVTFFGICAASGNGLSSIFLSLKFYFFNEIMTINLFYTMTAP